MAKIVDMDRYREEPNPDELDKEGLQAYLETLKARIAKLDESEPEDMLSEAYVDWGNRHAAKLFNAVQKAQVSWARIRPFLQEADGQAEEPEAPERAPASLEVRGASVFWPGQEPVLQELSFSAGPGQIIGVTGPVACGKSTLGKALIGEASYCGSIRICGRELRELSGRERSRLVSYMGHEPELMSDTLAENIRLGEPGDIAPSLRAACLQEEVLAMPEGADMPALGICRTRRI